MPSDLILSKFPTKYGPKSIIMRSIQPENITWEDIFRFIENKTTMPRKYIIGVNNEGKYVYGKYDNYQPFDYIKYALIDGDGKETDTALINFRTANL